MSGLPRCLWQVITAGQPEPVQQAWPGEPGEKQHAPDQAAGVEPQSVHDAAADRPHQPGGQPETVVTGVGGDQIRCLQDGDAQQGRRQQHQTLPWLALQGSGQPG